MITDSQPHGWDSSTTDRKLRILTELNEIEPILKDGFIIAYRIIKETPEIPEVKEYKPTGLFTIKQTAFGLRQYEFKK